MKTQVKKLFAVALLGLFTMVGASALTLNVEPISVASFQNLQSLDTQSNVQVAGIFDNVEDWEENGDRSGLL